MTYSHHNVIYTVCIEFCTPPNALLLILKIHLSTWKFIVFFIMLFFGKFLLSFADFKPKFGEFQAHLHFMFIIIGKIIFRS